MFGCSQRPAAASRGGTAPAPPRRPRGRPAASSAPPAGPAKVAGPGTRPPCRPGRSRPGSRSRPEPCRHGAERRKDLDRAVSRPALLRELVELSVVDVTGRPLDASKRGQGRRSGAVALGLGPSCSSGIRPAGRCGHGSRKAPRRPARPRDRARADRDVAAPAGPARAPPPGPARARLGLVARKSERAGLARLAGRPGHAADLDPTALDRPQLN